MLRPGFDEVVGLGGLVISSNHVPISSSQNVQSDVFLDRRVCGTWPPAYELPARGQAPVQPETVFIQVRCQAFVGGDGEFPGIGAVAGVVNGGVTWPGVAPARPAGRRRPLVSTPTIPPSDDAGERRQASLPQVAGTAGVGGSRW